MAFEYENVLLVKPEVFIYKIPPRQTNRGYRAADWTLDNPDWKGRLRVMAKGKQLNIKLEDATSGDLFAKCPVDAHPGVALEPVTDSSRYFVLRLQDDNGRAAFVGLGFADRGDSFDLNVALQDHFKWLKNEADAAETSKQPTPALNLGFKEGQTIKLNINTKRSGDDEEGGRTKARIGGGLGGGLLPPPPPPGSSVSRVKLAPVQNSGFSNPTASAPVNPSHDLLDGDMWNDFNAAPPPASQNSSGGWTNFN